MVYYKGNSSICIIYSVKAHICIFFKSQLTRAIRLNHLTSQRYSTTPAIAKTRGFNWIISGDLKRWDLVAQAENKGIIPTVVLEGNISHSAPAKFKDSQLSIKLFISDYLLFPLKPLNNHFYLGNYEYLHTSWFSLNSLMFPFLSENKCLWNYLIFMAVCFSLP